MRDQTLLPSLSGRGCSAISFTLMDLEWAKDDLLVILREKEGSRTPYEIRLCPLPERLMPHVCQASSVAENRIKAQTSSAWVAAAPRF